MKKFVAIVAALLLVCLTLAACESDPSDKYRYSKPDGLSSVTPAYSLPDSSVDEATQKLIDTATALLQQDERIINLFLNGTLDGAEYSDEESDVENYTKVLSDTFPSLDAVKQTMSEIYVNDEPSHFFLSCPSEEAPMLKGDDKSLYISNNEDFTLFPAYLDYEDLTVVNVTDTSATIMFTYLSPDYFYFESNDDLPFSGNLTMSLIDGVWKLDTSFYLYYAASNPDMPWVTQYNSSSSSAASN